jgi:hypothetical protein
MMKITHLLLALAAACPAAFAAPSTAGALPVGSLRLVLPDGATVIASAALSTGTALQTMSVDARKAFLMSNGRCAFNVKYDERSETALFATTNQIYDNDVLVAQNSKIDLAPGVVRTVWTQLYLAPGANNLRLVINTGATTPAKAWVRVQVNGACAATPEPPPTIYGSGTPQFRALYGAWGYSNYGVKQLQGKGYAKYDALVALNADLGVAVKAGQVEAKAWAALMARWNAIANDPDFQAAIKAVKPTGDTPPVTYGPGTSQWNAMHTAWGYSNYAFTQLKGKGFSKYDVVVAINADLTKAVQAGSVDAKTWEALMTRWNALCRDADFQAAMKAVVPTGDGPH